jgi:signal transduction histidine kinase
MTTPDVRVRLPNVLAYVIAAFAVVSVLVLPFAVAASDLSMGEVMNGFFVHTFVLFAVLGAVIVWRRPGHRIGWLLVLVGAFNAMATTSNEYLLFGLAERPGFPSDELVYALLGWAWVPATAGIAMALPLLFPEGRLLSPRWRPLAVIAALVTMLLSVVDALSVEMKVPDAIMTVAYLLYGTTMLACLVPLILRFHRSRDVERQQFKWVLIGLAVSIPAIAVGAVWSVAGGGGALTLVPLVVSPITITFAVLRYRLFDLDVVISRTLLVAGLAGFITATYVAIVVGIGSLVGRGDEPNLILSVAATALVAVAFQPVRRGLQRVANRLVFGRRATPYDVLSAFATRVGGAEATPETLVGLAALMADGTGAKPARVWLRVGSELRSAATWPQRLDVGGPLAVGVDAAAALPDADLAAPVREADELLGVLTIAKPRGERVTDVDVDLVERLAAASGVLLRNLRLDAELAERLEEIETSRRRLVSAQDEARRRIEAELGGGTRVQLTTLSDRLSTLARDVDAERTPKSATLLEQLVTGTKGALDTLASLAAGVYPPRLAADGLVAALTEQTSRAAVPIEMHESRVGRYPADVEAAVYFSVLEALQNVAKYADAANVTVRLTQDLDTLTFAVTDDGVGFDTAETTSGTGLQGIVDRLDTVNGAITIDSAPGQGTVVTGTVPITASPQDVATPTLAGANR